MNHCLRLELPDSEDRKEGDREDHILGKGQMSPLKDGFGKERSQDGSGRWNGMWYV